MTRLMHAAEAAPENANEPETTGHGAVLTTSDGRTLRVSFAIDPVMDLKAFAIAGHRVEARLYHAGSGERLTGLERRYLLPRDFQAIDQMALERGMSRLSTTEAPDKPRLIVQLSFASLSNSRARMALLDRARDLQEVMRQAVICELVDVESGVPASRLTEITTLVRGFFRSVCVQVQPNRALVEAAESALSRGLAVPAAELGDTPDEIARAMPGFISLVKRRSGLLVVTGLPTNALMVDAMSAGFSHATLHVQS